MEMREPAPIALFVYNRPLHTQKTLLALRENTFAGESELFIFSDGCKTPDDEPLISEVRNMVANVKGFKRVSVIQRDKNYGLAGSIIHGVSEILESHEKLIVLEDDLITSPYFLSFMNQGLELYEDEMNVASINGFFLPAKTKLPETFFLNFADCWGWATWRRAWKIFERDGNKLLNNLRSKCLQHEFDVNGAYPYTQMLIDQINGKNDSWAIRWYASTFLNNMLSLCPCESLVYHNGNDGSGTNFDVSKLLDVNLCTHEIAVRKIPVKEFSKGYKVIEKHFKKDKRNNKISLGMFIHKLMSVLKKINTIRIQS